MSTEYYLPLFFRTIRIETNQRHAHIALFDDKGANCGKICVDREDLRDVIISLSEGEPVAQTSLAKDGNIELHIHKLGYDEDYEHSIISEDGEVTTFADIKRRIALSKYERDKEDEKKN